MGPSHSSIDSYRDDSRFSSCTTRHPTQNPLRLSGVQRFLALCSEALKSSTVEISRKSRKEDLRNYPKVLKNGAATEGAKPTEVNGLYITATPV